MSRTPSGNEFAVGVVTLDDKPLEINFRDARGRFVGNLRGLQAEADQAFERMQKSISRVPTAFRTIPPAVARTTQSVQGASLQFSAFSATAALAGGQVGALASQALSAGQSIKLMTAALGPWAPLLAAAAAAVAVLNRLWDAHNKKIDEALERMQKFADATQTAMEKALTHAQRVRGLEDRLAVERGQLSPREARERAAQRANPERDLADIRRELDLEDKLARFETIKARDKDIQARRAQREKEEARERLAVEQEITQERRAQLDARISEKQAIDRSVQSAARSLAVRLGLATAADFESDPRLRRIAQIESRLNTPDATGGTRFTAQGFGRVAIAPGAALATKIGTDTERDKLKSIKDILRNSEDIVRLLQDAGGLG